MTTQDIIQFIKNEISKIESDKVLNRKDVNVFNNALVALMQMEAAGKLTAYKKILEMLKQEVAH